MRILFFFIICFTSLNCQEDNIVKLDRKDFSLSYPSNLELDENMQGGIVLSLSTKKENEKDGFIENLNLATKDIGSFSFEDVINKTINDINNIGEVIDKKNLTINGHQCYRLIFKLSQNNTNLKFIQDYYIKEQKYMS